MLKILILGGTNFIGRNLVETLINKDDCEITLLNRGLTNVHLFKHVNTIRADRNKSDFTFLQGQSWDYVIDLSCYYPHSLKQILANLNSDLKKYIFISTCSVYEEHPIKLKSEIAPIQFGSEAEYFDGEPNSYGKRKAQCERILAQSNFNFTILRPALVYGKYDSTDRFYYWLHQLAKYNSILIPGTGKDQFSITYVADLVHLICAAISDKKNCKVYNAVSHPSVSIWQIINAGSSIMAKKPKFVHLSPKRLNELKIKEWVDIPLWINNDFFTFSNEKIKTAFSIQIENLFDSIRETVHYYQDNNWPNPKYGVDRAKQLSLINLSNNVEYS